MPPRLSSVPRLLVCLCLAAIAVLAVGAPAVRAEDAPVITIAKSGGQTNLALNPLAGADGAAATKVLTDDLTLAGAFALQVGPGASATYIARGTAGGRQPCRNPD